MSVFEDTQIRYGGAAADDEDAQRKAEERERKKAEVRKRLEEAGQKKQKKGFLTPERKKKLRKLLMIKAAEDLKRQQLLKEQERVKILQERTIPLPDVDSISDHDKLSAIYNELFNRVCTLEEEKYDISYETRQMETAINQLNIEVNDLRGKFVKPSLKKVSKYDNKFKKNDNKESVSKDLRSNLKVVKKESVFTQISNKKKSEKPEWSKKNKEEKKEDAAAVAPVEEKPEEVAEEAEASEEEQEDEEE
ncbi:unnamed protein product [Caenorhabditis bovis]|uniref:Uncharacterized protein n=1 Tax=Caenorhabditis bovis TaxID=2654633 RepID=A0A8S1FCG8_9PELO|nr:unnamed protein product [Caenorhabditis bovis]